jgi:hypothetical protein
MIACLGISVSVFLCEWVKVANLRAGGVRMLRFLTKCLVFLETFGGFISRLLYFAPVPTSV